MNELIFLLSRTLAGLRNNMFYGGLKPLGNLFGVLSVISMWVWIARRWKHIKLKGWVFVIACLATICAVLVIWSFLYVGPLLDIHLWSYLESLMWPLMMIVAGEDPLEVLALSYTGYILFTGMIQLRSTGKFISRVQPTNDPAGKFFTINIGKNKLNIPRLTNGWIKLGICATLWLIYFANKYWWGNDWRIYKLLGIDVV